VLTGDLARAASRHESHIAGAFGFLALQAVIVNKAMSLAEQK
jgi:hypothetical protein